jgi:hypothetical protein
MNTTSNCSQETQSDPPPFDWRCTLSPVTTAGRYVAKHYRINPAVADLVASLAGIGEVRS